MITVDTIDDGLFFLSRAMSHALKVDTIPLASALWLAAEALQFELPDAGERFVELPGAGCFAEIHTIAGKLLQVRASLTTGPRRNDGQAVMESLAEIQRIHAAIVEAT